MDVILIFIFIFVFLASFLLLSRQKNLPPGPVSFPVLGCISMLKQLATGYPYIVLYEAGKKYGNVMSFKLGRELIVILNGFDAIHEALVKQADTFNDRPGHLPFVAALTKDGGGNSKTAKDPVDLHMSLVQPGPSIFMDIFSKFVGSVRGQRKL